jgi:hypothetical protein
MDVTYLFFDNLLILLGFKKQVEPSCKSKVFGVMIYYVKVNSMRRYYA